MKTFERPEAPNVAFPWLQIRLGGGFTSKQANFLGADFEASKQANSQEQPPPSLFTAPPFVQNGKDPLGVQGNPLGK